MPDSLARTMPRTTLPFQTVLPGLLLALALAGLGQATQRLTGWAALSPMMVAMVAGIAIRNTIGIDPAFVPGLKLALRPILRLGIVLLGVRLTFDQLAQVGLSGVAIIVATLAATFVFTKAAGRLLGVDRPLTELIAAGTSVCGASAILAVNTVTRARDEDVAYAIACVTIFGSVSMLVFPFLAAPLGFDVQTFGLWSGASIHEVAQAVGAGFSNGEVSGQAATVAKLGRVMLLAPLILSLGLLSRRSDGASGASAPVPWFVLGFIAVVALNSAVSLPQVLTSAIATVSSLFLGMALAAMGLETDLGKLRMKGLRPLALGALAWVFISTFAAVLVSAT